MTPQHLAALSFTDLLVLRRRLIRELKRRAESSYPCTLCKATGDASAQDACLGAAGCSRDSADTARRLAAVL